MSARIPTEQLRKHLHTWRHLEPDTHVTAWLEELVERRDADEALALIVQLASEVLSDSPPPGMTDSTRKMLEASLNTLDSILVSLE